MKNHIGNKNNIIKAVYALLIGCIGQLLIQFTQSITAQISEIFIFGFLYILPLIINSIRIKNYEIKSIKHFIVNDSIFLFPEFVLSCVITEFICASVSRTDYSVVGIGSVIFITIAILSTLIFWLLYFVFNSYFKSDNQ